MNRIIGHYELLREVGAGGAATVHLARDLERSRDVAVKLLHKHLTSDEAQVRRFRQEADWVSMLNHPNVLDLYEVGEADGTHFMVTEFVLGETLRHHIRSTMPLPLILDVAIGTAGALAAAHEEWIVHRDIKPENIMIRNDGAVKVLDFGLAKLTQPTSPGTKPLTRPGMVVGTLQYLAPEQIYGQAVDTRTDLYSLGAVLYEMVTGFPPFDGETNRDLLRNILQSEVPPLPGHVMAPPELEIIIHRALEKDMELRYQKSSEMLNDLKEIRSSAS